MRGNYFSYTSTEPGTTRFKNTVLILSSMTLGSYVAILTVGILVFSGANSVTDSFAVDDPAQITLCGMTDSFAVDEPEKRITLCDMGVLQLAAHDLFDVRRGNGTDPNAPDFENGRLDLTTLFVNTTDGRNFGDDVVRKGGEVRNRENVILFTVSAALGDLYMNFTDSGYSVEAAKEKTLVIYHQSFATAYQNTFDEPIPAKSRGQATPDGNIAFRTVHDFLPGEITFNGTTTELLSIPPNVRLSGLELMQLTSPLDGELDAQFLNITINHPGGPMITVNLLEVDQSFQTQFNTKFNFTSMLQELEDGRYNTTDTALQGIRELISVAYPEAYEISTRKSSSTPAPMVDMTSLVRSGLVTLPQQILEMYESHDRHLMGPVITTYQFDFPLAIDGKNYMLVDNTSTMQPQQVVVGNATDIVFTVYGPADIVHFALYFNLQGNDVDYSHSDTYIEYDRGTVQMYDLQGHIADASIVVTVEDAQQPNKKTVSATVEFEDAIGLTNMVAYMWDENRKPAFIRIIDAIEVVVAPIPDAPVVNPETTVDDSVLLLQSDLGVEVPSDDGSTSGADANLNAASSEEADTLLCIRMWAGFEPESLTDASFLTMIDLDYPDVDIPDWVMTDLGVLTAKNLVTVDEFKVALVYVLDSMTV